MTWYFATWDETGESQRFASIDAIVRFIMDYDLMIGNATFIAVKPDGQWRDCGLLIDAALCGNFGVQRKNCPTAALCYMAF